MTAFDCCESIAGIMIGHFATRLEVEAGKHGGSLSAAQIRALAEHFLGDEAARFQATYRRSYESCTVAREARQWESARRRPFDRILMKSFAHLFPPRQGDDGGQGVLSRRLIPGFNLAIDKMIGPALYEQCQRKSQAILDRHRSGSAYDWARIYADPDTPALVNDVMVVMAHYFTNFERRREWFMALVNARLGQAQPGSADAAWVLTEHGFSELMHALFADLRARMVKSADEIRKRYGEHTFEALEEFFRKLARE